MPKFLQFLCLFYPFCSTNTASQNQEEEYTQRKEYWNPTSRCHSPVIAATARKSVIHKSKCLGYLDLIKNIAALIAVGFLATLIHSDQAALRKYFENDADVMDFLDLSVAAQMTFFATFTILLTIAVLLSILVLQGIYEMDSQKIGIWFVYQLLAFIVCTIFHTCLVLILWVLPPSQQLLQPRKRCFAQFLSVILFINYYWVAYQMYIVNSLLREIRKERKSWSRVVIRNCDAKEYGRMRTSNAGIITSSPDSGWNEDVEYLV